MKSVRLFICAGLIILLPLSATIKKLDSAVIDCKAIAIQKMIERHELIVQGLTACAFLQQLPIIIEGVGSLFNYSMVKKEAKEIANAEKISFFGAMSQGFQNAFFTKEGWERSWPIIAGWAATTFIMQSVQEKFQHPDTLRWYIRSHVPYGKSIVVMKKVITHLQDTHLSDQDRAFKHIMCSGLLEQLANYGEDICAYIQYKASRLEGRRKINAEKCSRYLIHYHNDLLERIDTLLHGDISGYSSIIDLLDVYSSELMHYRQLFSTLEGESEYQEKMISF